MCLCQMLVVSGIPLGVLIKLKKAEGNPIEMPQIHSEDDDEMTRMTKDLVLKMICPEASDRYNMRKVCQELDKIERYNLNDLISKNI